MLPTVSHFIFTEIHRLSQSLRNGLSIMMDVVLIFKIGRLSDILWDNPNLVKFFYVVYVLKSHLLISLLSLDDTFIL